MNEKALVFATVDQPINEMLIGLVTYVSHGSVLWLL